MHIDDLVDIRFISRAPGNDWETGEHNPHEDRNPRYIVPRGATYIIDVLNKRREVILSRRRYQVGSGLTHDRRGREITPQPIAIMHSLVMDASGADDLFEDWCSDLGYDPDSRKALAIYLECQEIHTALRRGLTPSERESLEALVSEY